MLEIINKIFKENHKLVDINYKDCFKEGVMLSIVNFMVSFNYYRI